MTERKAAPKRKTQQAIDREFIQGFAAAVSTLAREHGNPSMAKDIMCCNGLSFRNFVTAGVEEFDLKPLRDEWRRVGGKGGKRK